jgi:hypothetical protein
MASLNPTATRPAINPWFKILAAVLAVLCLSAPSAVGVYRALEPTRGAVASGLAAAGFELAYLSLSLLTLRPELRRQARMVALGAVVTAITLNGLADYAARVAGGLVSWPAAVRLFDPLALGLSIIESAPLAALAYALASLLHRLAEEPAEAATAVAPSVEHVAEPSAEPAPALAWARAGYPAPQLVEVHQVEQPGHQVEPLAARNFRAAPAVHQVEQPGHQVEPLQAAPNADPVAGNTGNTPAQVYSCRHCQAEGLTKAEQLAHGRTHARERRVAEALAEE